MFKNYLKIAYRSLFKNKLATFINLAGLSAAIGCSIVVFLFIDNQYNRDAFHKNAQTTFFVESLVERNGQKQLWGFTPMPLGPALAADFPQVKRAVRLGFGGGAMRYADKVFDENIFFVENGFLDMLTFPLKYGEPNALAEKKNIILSDVLAQKYFGDANPVGKSVTLRFREDRLESFIVAGVAEKFPPQASFWFDALVSYEMYLDLINVEASDWKQRTAGTFIQVQQPQDVAAVSANLQSYIQRNNEASPDWPVTAFVFDNLLDLPSNSWKIRGDISNGASPTERTTLLIIGVFMLMLACFNYVNMAIASAGARLKEIGVRKVIGGKKLQLVGQFLSENLLLCALALVAGMALAQTFFAPAFNSLFPTQSLALDFGANSRLWIFFASLLLSTCLIAGLYPAFYISKFQPVAIFRGKQKLGGRSRFSKSLLTFQFVLSALLIAASVIFTQNATYQKNRDWGYNQAQVIALPINNERQFTLLRDALGNNPAITNVAGSAHHVGIRSARRVMKYLEQSSEVVLFDVGFNYLETMGLRLKTGRDFDENLRTDLTSAIIVNERMVKEMKWQEAVGQQVILDSTAYTIVGVVEDFHYADFRRRIEPALFRLRLPQDFRFVVVQAAAGKVMQTSEDVQQVWKTLLPDFPYNAIFQDEVFARNVRDNDGIRKLFTFIAAVALAISCMGLFGLVALSVAKRRKEFSIRKVLGANLAQITRLLNREFVVILSLAAVIATPVGYFLFDMLLDKVYFYRVAMNAAPFVMALFAILLTAVLTVSAQIYKVTTASPVEGLRTE
jgi:ABC-type antimicrobial peptide transport system permease subunit